LRKKTGKTQHFHASCGDHSAAATVYVLRGFIRLFNRMPATAHIDVARKIMVGHDRYVLRRRGLDKKRLPISTDGYQAYRVVGSQIVGAKNRIGDGAAC
jgi:hypothetical protein